MPYRDEATMKNVQKGERNYCGIQRLGYFVDAVVEMLSPRSGRLNLPVNGTCHAYFAACMYYNDRWVPHRLYASNGLPI